MSSASWHRGLVGAQACARRSLAVVIAATLLVACFVRPDAAHAGVAPGLGRKVTVVAREQQLPAFLNDLFSQIDVPVTVSPLVQGAVNGRFQGTADSVFKELARSFSLVGYHDGAIMHVFSAAEIATRTYGVDAAQAARIVRSAEELGLPDARNTLRTTRTGTLVALGTPRFLQQFDDLVRAEVAGAPARGATTTVTAQPVATTSAGTIGFRVFYLRHAWAQDTRVAFGGRQLVIPGVASVLRSVTAGLGQTLVQQVAPGVVIPASQPIDSDTLLRPSQPRLRGQGLAGIGRLPTLGEGAGGSAPELAERGGERAVQGGPSGSAAGASRYVVSQVGGAHIEADPRSNAVIVRDVVERLPMYEQLIAALDFEPQMVEVEATIVDINISRLQELGINWRWVNGRNDVLFGRGTDADTRLAAGQQITPTGLGMYVSTVLGSGANFISRINALASNGAARVVSRPQLITLSNVEALFDNNSTFYVRVAGRQEVDLFNVSAGTALRVTPNVFRDQEGWRIKLLVSVEDGNISKVQVDQLPVVDRSTINTQALIQEGESLLIGGMTRESSERGTDRVPVLGDVPIVGNLFTNRSETSTRFERLILITPRLVRSGRALASALPADPSRAAVLPAALPAPAAVVPAPLLPQAAQPAQPPQPAQPAQPAQVVQPVQPSQRVRSQNAASVIALPPQAEAAAPPPRAASAPSPAPASPGAPVRVEPPFRHVWPSGPCRDASGAPC
jgi:type III secretion protein C